jgi:hypothetical protein
MFFRMEPGRTPRDPASYPASYPVREPLCMGSVGVSTTEPWPEDLAGKRIYVFPDNGWRKDSPSEVERRLR